METVIEEMENDTAETRSGLSSRCQVPRTRGRAN